MPKCPECGKDRLLLTCRVCPLVCCYACALDKKNIECESLGDRWPRPPTQEERTKKPKGEIGPRGRLEVVNPRKPESNSTHISPVGHQWAPYQ